MFTIYRGDVNSSGFSKKIQDNFLTSLRGIAPEISAEEWDNAFSDKPQGIKNKETGKPQSLELKPGFSERLKRFFKRQ